MTAHRCNLQDAAPATSLVSYGSLLLAGAGGAQDYDNQAPGNKVRLDLMLDPSHASCHAKDEGERTYPALVGQQRYNGRRAPNS